jgi:hypothetical protein
LLPLVVAWLLLLLLLLLLFDRACVLGRSPDALRSSCSYQYTCTAPAVAARAAVAFASVGRSGASGSPGAGGAGVPAAAAAEARAAAEALILRAHGACNQGVMDEAPSYLQELALALENLDQVNPSASARARKPVPSWFFISRLMKKDGTAHCLKVTKHYSLSSRK